MPRWRWQAAAIVVAVILLGLVVRSVWVATHPQHTTVGSYFDNPPAWPGQPWSRNGAEVSHNVLSAAAGPDHCGWQLATFLFMGWPPGTEATTAEHARQYVRDPKETLPAPNYLGGKWQRNPKLPTDATDTGFRYGVVRLLIAASDDDHYIYLVAPADSERWPRSDPMTLCE